MENEIILLSITAAIVGFLHTIMGPDHYIPFITLAESCKWTKTKIIYITTGCGLAHVLSSVFLGLAVLLLGFSLIPLETIETFRSDMAGWMLISFGFVYIIWSLKNKFRRKKHSHHHNHSDGTFHSHAHTHLDIDHSHLHSINQSNTSWAIFLIFVFGPCEPLIPVLMVPAAGLGVAELFIIIFIFSASTILTMLGTVFMGLWGIRLFPKQFLNRNIHIIAGISLFFCGVGIQFIGF